MFKRIKNWFKNLNKKEKKEVFEAHMNLVNNLENLSIYTDNIDDITIKMPEYEDLYLDIKSEKQKITFTLKDDEYVDFTLKELVDLLRDLIKNKKDTE